MSKTILMWSAIPGALVALATLWAMWGLPTLAWSTDINRLDRAQVQSAVRLYQDEVRSLLSVQPPSDPVARQNWLDQLNQAKRRRSEAQQRFLELSK